MLCVKTCCHLPWMGRSTAPTHVVYDLAALSITNMSRVHCRSLEAASSMLRVRSFSFNWPAGAVLITGVVVAIVNAIHKLGAQIAAVASSEAGCTRTAPPLQQFYCHWMPFFHLPDRICFMVPRRDITDDGIAVFSCGDSQPTGAQNCQVLLLGQLAGHIKSCFILFSSLLLRPEAQRDTAVHVEMPRSEKQPARDDKTLELGSHHVVWQQKHGRIATCFVLHLPKRRCRYHKPFNRLPFALPSPFRMASWSQRFRPARVGGLDGSWSTLQSSSQPANVGCKAWSRVLGMMLDAHLRRGRKGEREKTYNMQAR